MDASPAPQSQNFGGVPAGSFKESLSDAIRFWEWRRIPFNAILLLVVLCWLFGTWPHFREALKLINLLRMAVLALLANLCYSAAYLVDLPLKLFIGNAGPRGWRWGLWSAGMLLAFVFANYWIADEIYPDFR
jgi:hypothetical protein